MTRALFVLLWCFALCSFSYAQAHPSARDPIRKGAGGLPQWSVKVIGQHIIRFTIDASLVDTCTEYYELEFVATLLNSVGASIATRRFGLPGVTLKGPSLSSYDFQYPSQEIAAVKGRALNCKKRSLGGLPAPGEKDDPAVEEGRLLQQSFEAERKSYREWLLIADPDYLEVYILRTNRMHCKSGSVQQTGTRGIHPLVAMF